MLARLMLATMLALALCFAPFAAVAHPPYVDIEQDLTTEELHVTGLNTLSPAQLEALNRLLRARLAKAAQAAEVVTADEPRAQRNSLTASYIGLNDKPIASRLIGAVSGWEPGTVFELDNGQQWKVLKGSMKLRKALQAPAVLVVPGVAGRWFLQVDEDLPKARVYRID